MAIKERLNLIIRELGLSGRAFEKQCKLTNGSYSSIGDGVGADKLEKILSRYPQFSADWLICGSGSMLKEGSAENSGADLEGEGRSRSALPLKRDDTKIFLLQIAEIVSRHQQEMSRLISEFELNGKRLDRLLNLIELGFTIDGESAMGQNKVNR